MDFEFGEEVHAYDALFNQPPAAAAAATFPGMQKQSTTIGMAGGFASRMNRAANDAVDSSVQGVRHFKIIKKSPINVHSYTRYYI